MLLGVRNRHLISQLLIVKFIFALGILMLYPLPVDARGTVRVRGYFRKDGTYVAPHSRTAPDGNPYNNYSYPGNYNLNTGQITPGDSQNYLDRYDSHTSSSGSSSIDFNKWLSGLKSTYHTVRGYFRKDGTYVAPHSRTAPDGNPHNNYSYPGNYNPNTGEVTSGDPLKSLDQREGGKFQSRQLDEMQSCYRMAQQMKRDFGVKVDPNQYTSGQLYEMQSRLRAAFSTDEKEKMTPPGVNIFECGRKTADP